MPGRDEVHGGGGGGPEPDERAQEQLLAPAEVGDRAEDGPSRPTRITETEEAKAKRERATGRRGRTRASATKKSGNTVVMTVVIQAELATS